MKKLVFSILILAASMMFGQTIAELHAGPNYYKSPYDGQAVNGVQGVVTAVKYYHDDVQSFFMQSQTPDGDDKTSEGIFVYTHSNSNVQIGDLVSVSGTLEEHCYIPSSGVASNITLPQIMDADAQGLTIEVLQSGLTVEPLVIGTKVDPSNPNKRIIPNATFHTTETQIDVVEQGATVPFEPAVNGLDFWRSIAAMKVQIDNPVFTGPSYIASNGKNYGNYLLADNGEGATTMNSRGGVVISEGDYNPELIIIKDLLFYDNTYSMPLVETGAKLNTSFEGVVHYDYNQFCVAYIDSMQLKDITPATNPKEITELAGDEKNMTVATFNVENLSAADAPSKFTDLANGIITNLKAPDVVCVEEIQDNDGTNGDTNSEANETWGKLIEALNAQDASLGYAYTQIDPVNGQDGGQPGGNIRVGFLYRSNRVEFVERTAPDGTNVQTTAVGVTNVDGKPQLTWSPGRVEPNAADNAWQSSRKALVGEFKFRNQTFFVVGCHFNSKRGDSGINDRFQPPILASSTQRNQQATHINNFIQELLAVDENAAAIVMGDLNDFQFSEPVNTLTGGGSDMTALDHLLPANEQYNYVYSGNSQGLDHILVTDAIDNAWKAFDVVHMNSEYNKDNRLSDHDPELALLGFTNSAINDGEVNVAVDYKLGNYPNPFNPSTTINYTLKSAAAVELSVYNYSGEKVADLVKTNVAAGMHNVVWNATNYTSGIYFTQLKVGNSVVAKNKMILVK